MAQQKSDLYKPPMFLLEYDVPMVLPAKQNNDNINIFGFEVDKNTKIPGTNITAYGMQQTSLLPQSGSQTKQQTFKLNGAQSQKKLSCGTDNSVNKVKSITTAKDKNFDNKSSHTPGGIPKTDASTVRTKTNPRTGWAFVRSSTLGYSVLPPGDNRKHILLTLTPAGAPDDITGVSWIKKAAVQQAGNLDPVGSDIWKKSDGIIKHVKDTYTFSKEGIRSSYKASGEYRVLILNDDFNFTYCVVNYLTGWAVTKKGTEISIPTSTDDPSGAPMTFPMDDLYVDGQFQNKNVNAINEVKTYKKYIIDFYKLSHWQKPRFGFGIEQFNFSGDSRKSIQQTRGTYEINKESENNFYVDSWGKGPEQITLVGVVELPYAYDKSQVWTDILPDSSEKGKSIIDTLEDFFLWNNNPQNINNGESLYLLDYYKQITYKVSFKNRKFTQSVDKPSLINFEMNFIVLSKSDKIEEFRK